MFLSLFLSPSLNVGSNVLADILLEVDLVLDQTFQASRVLATLRGLILSSIAALHTVDLLLHLEVVRVGLARSEFIPHMLDRHTDRQTD